MLFSHAFSATLLVFIWIVAVILLNSEEIGLSAELRVVETKHGSASGATANKY